MPLPYMGSKRKSAGKIYQTIKNHSPNSDCLVDLFCGGFAISEIFAKNGWKIIANDKNKYVVAILEKVISGELDEKKCLEFVPREKFLDIIKNPEKYEAWYVGYVMCCWSFGNNQKGYIFGKDIEKVKHAGHEIVVNQNPDFLLGLFPNFPKKYIEGILKQKDWHTRRIALLKVSNALKNRSFELERLQQLERLERLERLEQKSDIAFFSKSYEEIAIPENAVVYCDPPYAGTAEYREGGFDHARFWEWVRKISKTNKVYVSEYTAPADFRKVLEFVQKSTLCSGTQKHDAQPNECLFTL